MKYVRRLLEGPIQRAAKDFPAVLLTGPRRAGKTELLRHLFPRARYVLLEDPDVIARLSADPRGFVESLVPPVILDEIQNAPELFAWIRSRIDLGPKKHGQWFLTGSQEAPLMRGVTESMAGRAAIFELLPFSRSEREGVGVFRGGFPEVLARPKSADLWFRSYVRTYLERDVRQMTEVRDMIAFRRFLGLVASRVGQVLNRTDLSAPLGISVPTVSSWLSILEATGQILLVPPYFENFGKRLTKSPKLYFVDAGLCCHLLGLESEAALLRSPFSGPVFETFVASEIVKEQIHSGRPRALYFFRDREGLEVDFLVPGGGERITLLEAKASRTVSPTDAEPMVRLGRAMTGRDVRALVVHRFSSTDAGGSVLREGAQAIGVEHLGEALFGASRNAGPKVPAVRRSRRAKSV